MKWKANIHWFQWHVIRLQSQKKHNWAAHAHKSQMTRNEIKLRSGKTRWKTVYDEVFYIASLVKYSINNPAKCYHFEYMFEMNFKSVTAPTRWKLKSLNVKSDTNSNCRQAVALILIFACFYLGSKNVAAAKNGQFTIWHGCIVCQSKHKICLEPLKCGLSRVFNVFFFIGIYQCVKIQFLILGMPKAVFFSFCSSLFLGSRLQNASNRIYHQQ